MPVAHWTLLATLVDFSRPGGIEVFIDEETIDTLDQMMAQQGYLDGREMARAFRLLRSNSLIWHYFVHNYLYGETPPPFDVLYWNTDVTRMPRAMHSFYLREFYLHNKLIQKDALTIAGHPIDLGADPPAALRRRLRGRPHRAVEGDLQDRQAHRRAGALHAVVLGPHPRHHQSAGQAAEAQLLERRDRMTSPPDEWLKRQRKVDGSWWENWSGWLARRCGAKIAARPLGSAEYPVLEHRAGHLRSRNLAPAPPGPRRAAQSRCRNAKSSWTPAS